MLRISSRVTLCSFSKFSLPQALLKPNSICSLGAETCSYASIAARKERRKLPSAALPSVKDKDIPTERKKLNLYARPPKAPKYPKIARRRKGETLVRLDPETKLKVFADVTKIRLQGGLFFKRWESNRFKVENTEFTFQMLFGLERSSDIFINIRRVFPISRQITDISIPIVQFVEFKDCLNELLRLWYDTKDKRLKIKRKKNFDYFVGGKSFYTFLEAPKKEEDKAPESKIDQILNPNELKPAIKEEPILRENIIRMPAVQKVEKTEMIKVKIPRNIEEKNRKVDRSLLPPILYTKTLENKQYNIKHTLILHKHMPGFKVGRFVLQIIQEWGPEKKDMCVFFPDFHRQCKTYLIRTLLRYKDLQAYKRVPPVLTTATMRRLAKKRTAYLRKNKLTPKGRKLYMKRKRARWEASEAGRKRKPKIEARRARAEARKAGIEIPVAEPEVPEKPEVSKKESQARPKQKRKPKKKAKEEAEQPSQKPKTKPASKQDKEK